MTVNVLRLGAPAHVARPHRRLRVFLGVILTLRECLLLTGISVTAHFMHLGWTPVPGTLAAMSIVYGVVLYLVPIKRKWRHLLVQERVNGVAGHRSLRRVPAPTHP